MPGWLDKLKQDQVNALSGRTTTDLIKKKVFNAETIHEPDPYNAWNPAKTAYGKYQIKLADHPDFNLAKAQQSHEYQETYQDGLVNNEYLPTAYEYQDKYKSNLGINDIAGLTNITGRRGMRLILDGTRPMDKKISKENPSPNGYLQRMMGNYDPKKYIQPDNRYNVIGTDSEQPVMPNGGEVPYNDNMMMETPSIEPEIKPSAASLYMKQQLAVKQPEPIKYTPLPNFKDEANDIYGDADIDLTNKAKSDYFAYLDSPQYIKTAKKTWGIDAQKFIDKQKQTIQNTSILHYKDMNFHDKVDYTGSPAAFDVVRGNILNYTGDKTVLEHELSHSTDNNKMPSDFFQTNYIDPGPGFYMKREDNINPKYADDKNTLKNLGIMSPEYSKWNENFAENIPGVSHDRRSSEIRAYINTIRQQMVTDNFDWNAKTPDEVRNYIELLKDSETVSPEFKHTIESLRDGNIKISDLKIKALQDFATRNSKTSVPTVKFGGNLMSNGGTPPFNVDSVLKGQPVVQPQVPQIFPNGFKPQFALGGLVGDPTKPIIVNDPKDSRLQMYSDSLSLYNFGNNANSILDKESDKWYSKPAQGISNSPLGASFETTTDSFLSKFKPQSFQSYYFPDVASYRLATKNIKPSRLAGFDAYYSPNDSKPSTISVPLYKKPVQPIIYQPPPPPPLDRPKDNIQPLPQKYQSETNQVITNPLTKPKQSIVTDYQPGFNVGSPYGTINIPGGASRAATRDEWIAKGSQSPAYLVNWKTGAMSDGTIRPDLIREKMRNGGAVPQFKAGGYTGDPIPVPSPFPTGVAPSWVFQPPKQKTAEEISQSLIKPPTGWLDNYAVNDATSVVKPIDITKFPQKIPSTATSTLYDTNKKFEGTKDYFGDPSVGAMVSNGWANAKQNSYVRTMSDIVEAGMIGEMGILGLKLGQAGVKATGKYLIENTALKNTHTINPWAFKPQEGMMYRGLGKEGMEDALQSGVFRAKQNVEPIMDATHGRFQLNKQFSNTYYTPKFNIADQYGQGFIAEVPKDAAKFNLRYPGGKVKKTWSQSTSENIPIEKGKILKKDWLWGHKQIKIPKVENKSIQNADNLTLNSVTGRGENAYNIHLNNKLIGDFDLEKEGDKWIIGNVGINKEFQGKGFGKQSFIKANDLIKQKGEGVLHSSGIFHGEDAKNVWKSLVKEGKAEQIGADSWKFKEVPKVENKSILNQEEFSKKLSEVKNPTKRFEHGGVVGDPTKPIIVNDPNDRRLQMYNDSLSLYNFYNLQKKNDLRGDMRELSLYENVFGGDKFTEAGKQRQNELVTTAKSLLKSSPNLKVGLYSMPVATLDQYKEMGSMDIYSPNIKPKGEWMGTGKNSDYSNVKPVQPVVYQPKQSGQDFTKDSQYVDAKKYYDNKFGVGNYNITQKQITNMDGKPAMGFFFEDKNKDSHALGFNIPIQQPKPTPILPPNNNQPTYEDSLKLYNLNQFEIKEAEKFLKSVNYQEYVINPTEEQLRLNRNALNANEATVKAKKDLRNRLGTTIEPYAGAVSGTARWEFPKPKGSQTVKPVIRPKDNIQPLPQKTQPLQEAQSIAKNTMPKPVYKSSWVFERTIQGGGAGQGKYVIDEQGNSFRVGADGSTQPWDEAKWGAIDKGEVKRIMKSKINSIPQYGNGGWLDKL